MHALAGNLLHIAYFVVLPILIMIGLGFVLQRRLGLDVATLTRLNFYVVIPGMVYGSLVESALTWGDLGIVVGFSVLFVMVSGAAAYLAAMVRGVPMDQRRALIMAMTLYNSGNYGLPVQELAFRQVGSAGPAVAMQALVLVVQNVYGFTVGVMLAAGGVRDGA